MIKRYVCNECGYNLHEIYDYRTKSEEKYCRICKTVLEEVKDEVKENGRTNKREARRSRT